MSHIANIVDDLFTKYIEWVEDLGITHEEILITLLEKQMIENEDLRKRLRKYET